ncbi:hypothetical protein E0500_042130 [Streptomyces sp. KM273126]|nr:hypothetical protein [Streptomyces sp. KM273126]
MGWNLVRVVMCHQHSPCANDSPNPYEEKFFISNIINIPRTICLQTAQQPSFDARRNARSRAANTAAFATLRRAACTCGEADSIPHRRRRVPAASTTGLRAAGPEVSHDRLAPVAGLCAALLDAASRAPSEEGLALRLA